MSEKRTELLVKEFSKEFPNRNIIPMGLILSKNIDNSIVNSLFIVPNQVTYSMDGENIQPNFYDAKDFAKRIFDKLYLDYKCTIVCNYSCIVEADGISELLKNKVGIQLKDQQEIQGIGIKILLNTNEYTGNFIFEPFLRDKKYMFCSLELQIINSSSLNEIVKEAEKVFNDIFNELIIQSYHKIKNLGE